MNSKIQPIPVVVPWVYLVLQFQHRVPELGGRLHLPDDDRREWPANDRAYPQEVTS